jgi:Resolvase, N terminal domain
VATGPFRNYRCSLDKNIKLERKKKSETAIEFAGNPIWIFAGKGASMADRVATYDRIPTSEPAVLAALARRRQALTAWIDEQPGGLVYVRAYLDRAVSGNAQLQQRPALQRMVADARKHVFRLLVVHSLERLGRSPSVLLEILAALEPTEVTIRSLSPHEPPETLTRGQLVAHLRRLANFSQPDR